MTEGKTITIAGESGRISIIPFTSETPSTAHLYSEELSSTIVSTSPYFEEKIITTTPYTTRRIHETTLAANTNIIDDSVTEAVVPAIPTESSTRETIAAVSQPRPFGFPRRTRPTSPTTTVTEATRSTLRGYESTSRTKVSTHSRNVARITTKAPRTRTRTRTRNSEKLIGTVDDENAKIKEEALQNDSELQENQKDNAAVSRSRTRNRGSSRYKLQDANSRESSSKKTLSDNEQAVTPSRKYRRPSRVSTTSSDFEETTASKSTPERPIRNRNQYRRSGTRLDQQTADSFDSKAQAIQNINLIKQPITNTRRPTTITEYSFERTIANTKPVDDETTQNTRFFIEVTEPTLSETTTDQTEEETFNSLESSSQTTMPPLLWSSYKTSVINSADSIQTTIPATSTESISVELAPNSSEAPLSTVNQRTRKILVTKRPSTTPSSIDGLPRKKVESRRGKNVRRLRPLDEEEPKQSYATLKRGGFRYITKPIDDTTLNPLDNTYVQKKSSVNAALPRSRYSIRRKSTNYADTTVSIPIADISDKVLNKRKYLFERYRPASAPQINLENGTTITSETSTEKNYFVTEPFEISTLSNTTENISFDSRFKDSILEEVNPTDEGVTEKIPVSDSSKPRIRFRIKNDGQKDFENFVTKAKITPRYSSRVATTTTENSVHETLIPTKKFDYFADAVKRAHQLHRTTEKVKTDGSTTVSTSKPVVTRLVTSIVESATTERQKISIKKKYSSLTSTTFIPKFTTPSSYLFLRKPNGLHKDESLNEIPRGLSTERSVEWSTLPIESEFAEKKFTTESGEESSSTIEIESVFSNLIGH